LGEGMKYFFLAVMWGEIFTTLIGNVYGLAANLGQWVPFRPKTVTGLIFIVGYLCSRSEEHTSELQSRENLVCRLLLEKKKHYQWKAPHGVAYTCLALDTRNLGHATCRSVNQI